MSSTREVWVAPRSGGYSAVASSSGRQDAVSPRPPKGRAAVTDTNEDKESEKHE